MNAGSILVLAVCVLAALVCSDAWALMRNDLARRDRSGWPRQGWREPSRITGKALALSLYFVLAASLLYVLWH